MCCSWSALSEYGRSLRTDLQWINVVNTLTLHAGDLRLFGNSRVNILFRNRCTASKCRLWPLVIIVSMNFTCTMVLFKCDTFLLINYIHEKIGNFYAKLFFFDFSQFYINLFHHYMTFNVEWALKTDYFPTILISSASWTKPVLRTLLVCLRRVDLASAKKASCEF